MTGDSVKVSGPLKRCDICGLPANYDGKTAHGPWAYMCDMCMATYGVGLGTGKGQRLIYVDSR